MRYSTPLGWQTRDKDRGRHELHSTRAWCKAEWCLQHGGVMRHADMEASREQRTSMQREQLRLRAVCMPPSLTSSPLLPLRHAGTPAYVQANAGAGTPCCMARQEGKQKSRW